MKSSTLTKSDELEKGTFLFHNAFVIDNLQKRGQYF